MVASSQISFRISTPRTRLLSVTMMSFTPGTKRIWFRLSQSCVSAPVTCCHRPQPATRPGSSPARRRRHYGGGTPPGFNLSNIVRRSGHSNHPVEVRDQCFDCRQIRFKPAIPAREQNEDWAPLCMRELVGGECSAVSVNDRFFLGCGIAHEDAHDHSGTPAREVGLCDVSEAGLEFGGVGG